MPYFQIHREDKFENQSVPVCLSGCVIACPALNVLHLRLMSSSPFTPPCHLSLRVVSFPLSRCTFALPFSISIGPFAHVIVSIGTEIKTIVLE